MQRQTIHKAVAAFISAVVTILVSVGVAVPAWVTEGGIENVSWVIATIISLIGGGIVSGVTYQVSNKPKDDGRPGV